MIQCQVCGGRATDAFLCRDHEAELGAMLGDLSWWIDRLIEAAIGQTHMGDGGGGRATQRREPFKGDDEAIYPDGSERLLNRFLAAGGVNAKASRLLNDLGGMLSTWVRDICETRGIPTQNVRGYPPGFIGPLQKGAIRCKRTQRPHFWALWLTEHVSALAASEGAGECFSDVLRATQSIERIVNRPIPWKWLGPCPTWIEDKRQTCGRELRARADAIEVRCPTCRQTHNCNRLQLLLVNDLERSKVTIARILELNRVLPEEYRIPERTLRHWRQHDKLKPKGWMRPDGSHGINRRSDEDEPLYAWSDVRKLRAEQWKVKAG